MITNLLWRRASDPEAAAAQERERAEAAERRHRERTAREVRSQQAAERRRQVAGHLANAALSWSLTVWLEGAMWLCLAGGLAVDYIGSYADLAATFGAFGYDGWVRWIMPLGIDLPVTASVLGQLLAGRWRCGWWVRVRLGILTAVTAPLTLVGNALRGALDAHGHFTSSFHVQLWMDLAAFAVPGLGVVLIGWVASMMQGERAELTRRRLEAEALAQEMVTTLAAAGPTAPPAPVAAVAAPVTAALTAGDRDVTVAEGASSGQEPAMAAVAPRPSAGDDTGHDAVMTAGTRRSPDGRSSGHAVAAEVAASPVTVRPSGGRADGQAEDREVGHEAAADMTAEEARTAVVRLVRQARRSGRAVTAADVERVTGRKARQARRLLTLARAAATDDTPARRPRVLSSQAADAGAAAEEA